MAKSKGTSESCTNRLAESLWYFSNGVSGLITANCSVAVVAFGSCGGTTCRRRLKEVGRPSSECFETFVVAQVLRLTITHYVVLAFHHLSQASMPAIKAVFNNALTTDKNITLYSIRVRSTTKPLLGVHGFLCSDHVWEWHSRNNSSVEKGNFNGTSTYD